MTYGKVIPGVFHKRPNRFIAHVETEAGLQVCHVKKTKNYQDEVEPEKSHREFLVALSEKLSSSQEREVHVTE